MLGGARPTGTRAVAIDGDVDMDVEAVVIGAGAIGLATARRLAENGHDVVVIEAEKTIGQHTSSRNSEVIHAGMYYPQNSLKARMCVAGREALYRYCADRGVPAKAVGKLVVATHPSQVSKLQDLAMRADYASPVLTGSR